MTDKAVCWELQCNGNTNVAGLRVLLVGNAVGDQLIRADNARPRWAFRRYATPQDAAAAAVAFTQNFESDYAGSLVIPPVEIMVHPAEVAAIRPDAPIPPSLRARVFTALLRHDPRDGGAR